MLIEFNSSVVFCNLNPKLKKNNRFLSVALVHYFYSNIISVHINYSWNCCGYLTKEMKKRKKRRHELATRLYSHFKCSLSLFWNSVSEEEGSIFDLPRLWFGSIIPIEESSSMRFMQILRRNRNLYPSACWVKTDENLNEFKNNKQYVRCGTNVVKCDQ